MDYSWNGIKKSLAEFWSNLSRSQKIITVIAPLLVAGALLSLVYWASRPQYEVIFTKLNDSEAGAITTKLKELKVDYQLADNGSTIMVRQDQAAEVRLDLANAGLPQGSKFSFDSLNQMRLGETDADRKLRYILGLQNEIEITLKTLDGVQDARVHLVMPEQSLFAESQKPTTAAVTLKLVPGTSLKDEQVRAVANVLASSVEGLQPENVTIVDTNGNVLSDILGKANDPQRLSGTQLQLQQAVEDDVQKSLQSMLDRVLGPGKTVVRANASLDFDQLRITQQTHGPGAVVSKQSSNEQSSNGSQAGSTPGVNTNVPGYQTPSTSGNTSSSSKTTTVENYQVDVTQQERIVSPGAIKRLSVSVMADSDSVTDAQLQQIKEIVASAAGIDVGRGDQIQVAAIPFDKTGLQAETAAMAEAEKKQQILTYAEMGSAALLGIFFLLMIWRLRKTSKTKQRGYVLGQNMQPVPLAVAEEFLLAQRQAEEEAQFRMTQKKAKTAEEIERQKMKEAVDGYARNNSTEAARLMKAWLAEDR